MTAQRLPDARDPRINLGNLYARGGHPAKAIEWYRAALQSIQSAAVTVGDLAIVLQDIGLVVGPRAIRAGAEANAGESYDLEQSSCATRTTTRYDPAAIFRGRWEYQNRIAGPWAKPLLRSHFERSNPERRLRIAYISYDFRRHPVGFFIEPILARPTDPAATSTSYSCSAETDEVTQRLGEVDLRRLASCRRHERTRSHRADFRADKIDILIDLAGHTHRPSRLYPRRQARRCR